MKIDNVYQVQNGFFYNDIAKRLKKILHNLNLEKKYQENFSDFTVQAVKSDDCKDLIGITESMIEEIKNVEADVSALISEQIKETVDVEFIRPFVRRLIKRYSSNRKLSEMTFEQKLLGRVKFDLDSKITEFATYQILQEELKDIKIEL